MPSASKYLLPDEERVTGAEYNCYISCEFEDHLFIDEIPAEQQLKGYVAMRSFELNKLWI